MLTIDRKSLERLDNFRKAPALYREGILQGFYDIGRQLRRDAKKSIADKNKTGRLYRRRLRGRVVLHRASAPGEPPANFTGRLKNTVGYTIRKSGFNMEFGAGNQSNVKYAGFLENGTRKIRKRPYLKRAIDQNQSNIIEYFKNAIDKQLKTL